MMAELSNAQEARLLHAARCIDDSARDSFFKHAADILRPLRWITDGDVSHAISFAREKIIGTHQHGN
jgi:hypothetical protein